MNLSYCGEKLHSQNPLESHHTRSVERHHFSPASLSLLFFFYISWNTQNCSRRPERIPLNGNTLYFPSLQTVFTAPHTFSWRWRAFPKLFEEVTTPPPPLPTEYIRGGTSWEHCHWVQLYDNVVICSPAELVDLDSRIHPRKKTSQHPFPFEWVQATLCLSRHGPPCAVLETHSAVSSILFYFLRD